MIKNYSSTYFNIHNYIKSVLHRKYLFKHCRRKWEKAFALKFMIYNDIEISFSEGVYDILNIIKESRSNIIDKIIIPIKQTKCAECSKDFNSEKDNKELQFTLPCKCIFCNINCVKNYLDRYYILKNHSSVQFFCACGYLYSIKNTADFIIKLNSSNCYIKQKEFLIYILQYGIHKHCCRCGERTDSRNVFTAIGFSSETNRYLKYRDTIFSTKHYMCPKCYQQYIDKGESQIFCIHCQFEHFNISKLDLPYFDSCSIY